MPTESTQELGSLPGSGILIAGVIQSGSCSFSLRDETVHRDRVEASFKWFDGKLAFSFEISSYKIWVFRSNPMAFHFKRLCNFDLP
ncbi:MAG: hypothetical protein ACFFBD_19550 [Candidatus Hodarchaeota archaeon]